MQQIILPSVEDIVTAHEFILQSTAGRRGVRDEKVIEAAVQRPVTYMQYRDCSLHVVCALLLDSLARNHGFTDGNKRSALLTTILTYSTNGTHLEFSKNMNKCFEDLALKVVEQKPSIDEIAEDLERLVNKFRTKNFRLFLEKLLAFFKN